MRALEVYLMHSGTIEEYTTQQRLRAATLKLDYNRLLGQQTGDAAWDDAKLPRVMKRFFKQ